MADNKESSVLFSLNELMGLEEDRIQREEAARAAAARAEQDARLSAERAQREKDEQRARAAAEQKRAEEQRRREEETRLEAIRAGELEKAKADAEHEAQLRAMKERQAHEAQLLTIRQDQSKKKLKLAVTSAIGLLIAAVAGGGYLVARTMQEREHQTQLRAEADERNRVAAEAAEQNRAEKERADAEQLRLRKEIEDLRQQLGSAKTDEERQAIQARIENKISSSKPGSANASKPAAATPKPAKGPKETKPCNCTPGDPLCSCF